MDKKAEKAQNHRYHDCHDEDCHDYEDYPDYHGHDYHDYHDYHDHDDDPHSNELRLRREDAVRRIEGYHRHIDNCEAEISEFSKQRTSKQFFFYLNFFSGEHERKIDECQQRIRRQRDMIRLDFVLFQKVLIRL